MQIITMGMIYPKNIPKSDFPGSTNAMAPTIINVATINSNRISHVLVIVGNFCLPFTS